MTAPYEIRYGKVKIRRDLDRPVRRSAEQIDGGRYRFSFGWLMDEDDPYPGEEAWMPSDTDYPSDAPAWIASGDIQWDSDGVIDEQLRNLREHESRRS